MRREGSHASPLEARGQGNVDPGVPRGDLQVAVEHARLLRQEAVGQRLPPLDRVRRPDSPNQFLRVRGELLGGDQRAARRFSGTCGAIGSRGSSAGKDFTIAREGVLAADVCGQGSVSSLTCRSRKTLPVRAEMTPEIGLRVGGITPRTLALVRDAGGTRILPRKYTTRSRPASRGARPSTGTTPSSSPSTTRDPEQHLADNFERLTYTTDLPIAVSDVDLISESVPESMDINQALRHPVIMGHVAGSRPPVGAVGVAVGCDRRGERRRDLNPRPSGYEFDIRVLLAWPRRSHTRRPVPVPARHESLRVHRDSRPLLPAGEGIPTFGEMNIVGYRTRLVGHQKPDWCRGRGP